MEALKTAAEATGTALLCIVMVAAAIRLLRPRYLCGNHWIRQAAKRQAKRRERERRRRRCGSGS